MTKHPLYEKLRETSWRRKLTPAEEEQLRAWLAAHPDALADWEAEEGLNASLLRLPPAPVPSNFTARVLQAVQREQVADQRVASTGRGFWSRWLSWLPRTAVATVVLAAGMVAVHHSRVVGRERIAASVKEIANAASVPSPDVLEHFDDIKALSQSPTADVDLLKALQ